MKSVETRLNCVPISKIRLDCILSSVEVVLAYLYRRGDKKNPTGGIYTVT
jgi:hypothetical protein